jgi:hypothetical protein
MSLCNILKLKIDIEVGFSVLSFCRHGKRQVNRRVEVTGEVGEREYEAEKSEGESLPWTAAIYLKFD